MNIELTPELLSVSKKGNSISGNILELPTPRRISNKEMQPKSVPWTIVVAGG